MMELTEIRSAGCAIHVVAEQRAAAVASHSLTSTHGQQPNTTAAMQRDDHA
jgi:hypothetical protein